MNLQQDLQKNIDGEVHFDAIHKQVYSIDASIFEIEPIGVVIPKTTNDLHTAVAIARKYDTPIIPRGAATGITGGCIGKALIIDHSKYLNRIIEINYDQEYAICQPGVIQDRLNEALASKGYRLGPDTSTGNRATIGGMIANNAAGARSLLYGTMADHILEMNFLLYNGESIHFQSVNNEEIKRKCLQENQEGCIYQEISRIRTEYRQDIEENFPKIPRRVSGYNLDSLINTPLNPCRLIAGSEGSLGIITEAKLKICRRPKYVGLCIVHFLKINDAMHSIDTMLEFHPISLEMIDDKIISMGRLSPVVKNKLEWLVGSPETIFGAEFEGDTPDEVQEKLSRFASEMQKRQIGYAHICLTDKQKMENVWEVRKSGLGLLLSKRTYSRAIAFIEDLSVPPAQLSAFMNRFSQYLKSESKEAGIYGHVGSGCMHIRPYIDLRSKKEVQLMVKIMNDISDLVLEHGGALSGEHGDGLIRSWLNKKMFGERLYQAFLDIKKAFDPDNRMNPGKIVNGPAVTENLRLTPETKIGNLHTFLDFQSEGGMQLAADLCNGNGLCRKAEKIMCPSFQATGDEFHSTRARAQALRSVINSGVSSLPADNGLHDVLDLCLQCKGCKTECPSQVDMAKMKAEFLHHYNKKHGVSLRDWLFANIGMINSYIMPFSSLFNAAANSMLGRCLADLIGISSRRPLPQLAKNRFSQWTARRNSTFSGQKKVVLFNDTFNEFNHPEVGIAAISILEKMGYEVITPSWQCCGRTAISKGLLEKARNMAMSLMELLFPYAAEGVPIIGLEPSCLLTIKDDFIGLLGHNNSRLKTVIAACLTLPEFLSSHIKNGRLPIELKGKNQTIKVHGHCHQKALVGMQPTLNVLKAIPELNVFMIESGCCGLAGSFGYEKDHYDVSMAIGNLHLFPAVKSCPEDTILLADGFSCRCQITHGTKRNALHLAQFLHFLIEQ